MRANNRNRIGRDGWVPQSAGTPGGRVEIFFQKQIWYSVLTPEVLLKIGDSDLGDGSRTCSTAEFSPWRPSWQPAINLRAVADISLAKLASQMRLFVEEHKGVHYDETSNGIKQEHPRIEKPSLAEQH